MKISGRIRIDFCSGCGQERPIARQRDTLCAGCLTTERQLKAWNRQQARQRTISPICAQIKPGKGFARPYRDPALSAVLDQFYRGVWRLWELSGPVYCIECREHLPYAATHVSHLITRGSRPDPFMALNTMNVVPMCGPCHSKWEFSANRKNMQCFERANALIVKVLQQSLDMADYPMPKLAELLREKKYEKK